MEICFNFSCIFRLRKSYSNKCPTYSHSFNTGFSYSANVAFHDRPVIIQSLQLLQSLHVEWLWFNVEFCYEHLNFAAAFVEWSYRRTHLHLLVTYRLIITHIDQRDKQTIRRIINYIFDSVHGRSSLYLRTIIDVI